MRVAVLTYHSQNIGGSDYRNNDHVALDEDLHLIEALGLPLVSLRAVVDALDGHLPSHAVDRGIAITCDDGTIFDWQDHKHPAHGWQRSFASLIHDHASRRGIPVPALTAFVIASPAARNEIDRGCYAGHPYSSDGWWADAAISGRVAIENHSWDHAHRCVTEICQREQRKETFLGVETWDEADGQIRRAADFIDAQLGQRQTQLFAYPYGEASDYLAREYFPHFTHQHRVRGAFTNEPEILTPASDRWRLPRFVCGAHWRSPQELTHLLAPLAT